MNIWVPWAGSEGKAGTGMTNTLDTTVGEAVGEQSAAERASRGFGWRRLQVLSGIAMIASFLVPMVIQLSFEPFLLAMIAPLAIGLLLMLRWRRVGVVWLGVIALLEVLTSAPFLADALTHPEAMADFIPLSVFVVTGIVTSIATIPSFREGPGPVATRRPGAVAVVAGALIVAGGVTSVVAASQIESVRAHPGDVAMVTQDLEFAPAVIEAEGSTVSVHVTNKDSFRHTFTIDELEIELELPPNSAQRISFTADPGTYRFYCSPHDPAMEGELTVR